MKSENVKNRVSTKDAITGYADQLVKPLRSLLDDPTIDDVSLNPNGSVYVKREKWEKYESETINPKWALALIQKVSVSIIKKTNSGSPIISTDLPTGERIEGLIQPAVRSPVITVRRSDNLVIPLSAYSQANALMPTHGEKKLQEEADKAKEAHALYDARKPEEAMQFMIKNKFNMIFSGETGSGKTTISQAVLNEIPRSERIISIEDSAELKLDSKLGFENSIALFYARESSANANDSYTADELIISCLRLRPDRIMLSEMRGSEAYHFFKAIATGHGGAITSIHAKNPRVALDSAIAFAHDQKPHWNADRVKSLVVPNCDVIMQWSNRTCKSVYFPSLDKYVEPKCSRS